MRIDLVITELFIGGAERCLVQLAGGLAKRGHRIRVACLAAMPSGPQAELIDRLRDQRISVESAGCGRYRDAWRAYRWLRRWFSQGRPDIVQSMLFHANTLGAFAAAGAKVPRLVGGIRVAEKSRVRSFAEGRAIRRMHAIVCVSESVRTFMQAEFGGRLPPTTVIPNSIDLAGLDRVPVADWTSIDWPADAQVLLFVGRLHPQKGIDVLMESLPPLLERAPELRCALLGNGPQRDQWFSAARRLGRDRVRLLGWRSDAVAWIKACRVLVLPSRYEGMPNVVLEAMAAGKPVAAARVEGVSELLRENTEPQSCFPEDPTALTALIERLWTNPSAAAELGQSNRRLAEQHHSPEKMVEAYERLYESLLE